MKPGIAVGHKAEAEVSVTDDMTVLFEGERIHDLYSTSALVHDMELVARRLLAEHMEEGEESMVYHADVSHLSMTLPGMTVKLTATVCEIRDNKIVAEVEATNVRGRIARGTITLAVVEKGWLDNRMKEIAIINSLAQAAEAREPQALENELSGSR